MSDTPTVLEVPLPRSDVKILVTGNPTPDDVGLLIEYLQLVRIAAGRTTPKAPGIPKWIPWEWLPR